MQTAGLATLRPGTLLEHNIKLSSVVHKIPVGRHHTDGFLQGLTLDPRKKCFAKQKAFWIAALDPGFPARPFA